MPIQIRGVADVLDTRSQQLRPDCTLRTTDRRRLPGSPQQILPCGCCAQKLRRSLTWTWVHTHPFVRRASPLHTLWGSPAREGNRQTGWDLPRFRMARAIIRDGCEHRYAMNHINTCPHSSAIRPRH